MSLIGARASVQARLVHILIFLPALLFWIGFTITFRLANLLTKNPRYQVWHWMNVLAVYDPETNIKFTEE